MTAVMSFEELTVGQEVAVQPTTGSPIQKWRVTETGLSDGRATLDTFFFEGLLATGKVFLHDFRPPEVGEWFGNIDGVRYLPDRYLVIDLIDVNRAQCAQFRGDRFQDWCDVQDLTMTRRRIEAPEWSSPQLLAMSQRAWGLQKENNQSRTQQRNMRDARMYVTNSYEYLRRAQELLT